MGYVYLIKELNNSGVYKIGATNKSNINDRKDELQTGNPNELMVLDYFETSKPYKLEKMIHNHFREFNQLNEWFELESDSVKNFKNTCNHYQGIIDSLKDNPFFQ